MHVTRQTDAKNATGAYKWSRLARAPALDSSLLTSSSLSDVSSSPFKIMVATVQKPAPAFKGTAVVDGLFQDISLSDYLGQWYVLVLLQLVSAAHRNHCCRG